MNHLKKYPKFFELDKEEQELEDSIERGEWEISPHSAEIIAAMIAGIKLKRANQRKAAKVISRLP
jgi:CRISPR/Cas system endoribonuclease Cas6 (RAMP superfamily)